MESIIQKDKECFICGSTQNLHCHHIFHGTANRKVSEENGFKVWLCMEHHTGAHGVHSDGFLNLGLKQYTQRYYEANKGNRDAFIKLIGKSYL